MSAEGDCGKVVRCDRAGSAGDIRLAELKCPNGLAFDLHLQTCDWKANVKASSGGVEKRTLLAGGINQHAPGDLEYPWQPVIIVDRHCSKQIGRMVKDMILIIQLNPIPVY